jgi:hypothetical protein
MHARVTTVTVGPGEPESTAEIFLVLSLWESADAMEASEAMASCISAAETSERDYQVEEMTRYRVDTFDLAK